MATIVGYVVGGVIGGIIAPGAGAFSGAAIGGMIGGAIGGYIDSTYLMPLLFGRPSFDGPKLDDLQLQTASEGSPIKFVLGPTNRVAGTLIWRSPELEKEEITHGGGGKGGGGGGGATETRFYLDLAVGVCEGPIADIKRIWADGKLIYDADNPTTNRWSDIQIYLGSSSQSIDPTMEAIEGVGNVPRYKHLAYVVFTRFALADFGNRIPNFTFEVQAQEQLSLADAIGLLLERHGLEETEYDVSRVAGCLRGYVMAGPVGGYDVVKTLIVAYGVNVQEVGGELVFFMRGEEVTVELSEADLAAHSDGSDAPRPVLLTDHSGFDLPTEVTVRHIDPEQDMQTGSQIIRSQQQPHGEVSIPLDFPFVLTAKEAKRICRRMLWCSHAERATIEVNLPPSYIHMLEGDAATVTVNGETYLFRNQEINRGSNFQLRIKGVLYQPHLYQAISEAADPSPTGGGQGGGTTSPPTTLVLLDGPALRDQDTEIAGYYYATCATSPDSTWPGGALYSSSDGSNYDLVAAMANEARIGETKTILGQGEADVTQWDDNNTVEVEMLHGELESKSESQVLDGANRMMIGNELIGFRTATLVDTRRYRLSGFLRGLRGTESYMGDHDTGETVVLLQAGPVGFKDTGLSILGGARQYKSVPIGATIAEYPDQAFTMNGGTLKPLPPCNIRGTRNSTNDLTIRWQRRTRAFVRPFTTGQYPFLSGEDPEKYEIEILGDGIYQELNEVLRTITLEGTREDDVEYEATTISALAADNSLNDSANQFLVQGFEVGQYIEVEGFTGGGPSSPESMLIESVTAGKIIVSGYTFVDDAAGEKVVIRQGKIYKYTAADQDTDFGTGGGHPGLIPIRIYQMSTLVGRGFVAEASL